MSEDRCTADFIDCTVDCELPAGHEGDHEGTVTWEQAPPAATSVDPWQFPGYAAFVMEHYAAQSESPFTQAMRSTRGGKQSSRPGLRHRWRRA